MTSTEGNPSDPVSVEVFRHLFTAISEEMGAALRRAAFSPNIKERRDYSCAVFSPGGAPVAQGDHMPVHLGAMPLSVAAVLDAIGPLGPGDIALVNDPFQGGSHLPDLTLVSAVHGEDGGVLLGYVAARAHHADVGGMSAGSMPVSREIYQEGFRIPPVLLVREGRRVEEVWRLLLANVRTPVEREGDLDAQIGALHVGRTRLLEMAREHGETSVLDAQRRLLSYGDRLLREGIRRIGDGWWEAEDALDDDGISEDPISLRVRLTISGDRIRLDFEGSAGQVAGSVNAPGAVTVSACRYVVRCVVQDVLGVPLPAGGGSMEALEVVLPERSVVNAEPPAAVAGGNVETSQRITDTVLRAFSQALPDRIPALSQGTMNNLTIGGVDPRSGHPFAYYETLGGGMGAGPESAGLSGVHTHMSNTLNTPVEALEHAYPFRIHAYSLRRDSGGGGLHRGGDGLSRDWEVLGAVQVTLLCDRRKTSPAGFRGGHDGLPGQNLLIRDGHQEILPGKTTFFTEPGDRICIRTPGGGGWGSPRTQELEDG